jgi:membrane protease YdiL (CAAX protease family)
VAPAVEELFFRGFIYRAFRNSVPVLPAVLANGVLFGAAHAFIQHIGVLPVLGFTGCVCCLLYERTRSLLPAIALHSYIDATGFEYAIRDGRSGITFLCLFALALVFFAAPWRWDWSVGPRPT